MRHLADLLARLTPISSRSACEGGYAMRRTSSTEPRADIYTRVTESILAQLEQGTRPWLRPWNAEHLAGQITRPLRAGGQPYRGINVVMLWLAAAAKGYAAPIWITYRQAQEVGGQVRKGEQGTAVAYADKLRKTETADNGEVEKEIFFLKQYSVFNVEQVDGLPPHLYATAAVQPSPLARLAHAEAFFAALGANLRHGGNRACYRISDDVIQMPPFEAFRDAQSYYATLAHEAVHWTRHPSRLAREFGRKRWGDEGYAQEELVADLGLALEPREDHAAYISSWLEVAVSILKCDSVAFSAAPSTIQHVSANASSARPSSGDWIARVSASTMLLVQQPAPSMPFDPALLSFALEHDRLLAFLVESLAIEGIRRPPTPQEVGATRRFLSRARVTQGELCRLQAVYAPDRPLRDQAGMDVRVGGHLAPPGGPDIGRRLAAMLRTVNQGADPWATHVTFEKLHPFLDGNGRAGRALWAWQMRKQGRDPFALPFLHRFYYQTLAAQP